MDLNFFDRILNIDSTSGREVELADYLSVEFAAPGRKIDVFEVGDGSKNILVSWGVPKVLFCTHLDTVPPYIAPTYSEDGTAVERAHQCRATSVSEVLKGNRSSDGTRHQKDDGMPLGAVSCADWEYTGASAVNGRGTCDAKGQIFAMYEACRELEKNGRDGFGLLLLAGEETGSFGAKAFNAMSLDGVVDEDCVVIVGEPTDNCMASAAKGTKAFEVNFAGKAFHSGYPEHGVSAIEMFNDFMNALRSIRFPHDPLLGETTWNIGKLSSDNPQNILSDRLSCRVYFRTTFESDEMVSNIMKNIAGPEAKLRFGRPKAQDGSDVVGKDVALWQKLMSVKALGGDTPTRFETLDGFEVKPVSFGSDAPQLTCFRRKILCGPGSILVAHRPDEHIALSDLETAKQNYISMFNILHG